MIQTFSFLPFFLCLRLLLMGQWPKMLNRKNEGMKKGLKNSQIRHAILGVLNFVQQQADNTPNEKYALFFNVSRDLIKGRFKIG